MSARKTLNARRASRAHSQLGDSDSNDESANERFNQGISIFGHSSPDAARRYNPANQEADLRDGLDRSGVDGDDLFFRCLSAARTLAYGVTVGDIEDLGASLAARPAICAGAR